MLGPNLRFSAGEAHTQDWENEKHLFFLKIWIIIFKSQHVIEFFYQHFDLAILRMVTNECLHSMSFLGWSGFPQWHSVSQKKGRGGQVSAELTHQPLNTDMKTDG